MNSTLTSFTRACSVIIALCESSESALEFPGPPLPVFDALRVGAPEMYADCAGDCPTHTKVANKIGATRKVGFVYFMPEKSNFFTLNYVWLHSQAIRCTLEAEIGCRLGPTI